MLYGVCVHPHMPFISVCVFSAKSYVSEVKTVQFVCDAMLSLQFNE